MVNVRDPARAANAPTPRNPEGLAGAGVSLQMFCVTYHKAVMSSYSVIKGKGSACHPRVCRHAEQ